MPRLNDDGGQQRICLVKMPVARDLAFSLGMGSMAAALIIVLIYRLNPSVHAMILAWGTVFSGAALFAAYKRWKLNRHYGFAG